MHLLHFLNLCAHLGKHMNIGQFLCVQKYIKKILGSAQNCSYFLISENIK